jgi:hypothetical protein
MDRLARNLDDLRRIVQGLTERAEPIEFIRDEFGIHWRGLLDGQPDAVGNGSLRGNRVCLDPRASARRDCVAQAAWAYRGRKKSLSDEHIADLKCRVAAGEQKTLVARDLGSAAEPCISTAGRLTMPRRSILSATERESPLALPDPKTI